MKENMKVFVQYMASVILLAVGLFLIIVLFSVMSAPTAPTITTGNNDIL